MKRRYLVNLSAFFILFFVFALFCPTAEAQKIRGRNEFSIVLDENVSYGYTDKYNFFFDVVTKGIKTAQVGGRFGLEGVCNTGFGFRLLGGYQRVVYSNKGIEEIKKNFISTELLVSYYLLKNPHHLDPYLTAGPVILFNDSEQQGFASGGGGVRYFFNNNWSLRTETVAVSDFHGVWGKFNLGLGFHF